MLSPFSLQCSLQYLPNSPPFFTMQLQAGWAHLFTSAIATSLRGQYIGQRAQERVHGGDLPILGDELEARRAHCPDARSGGRRHGGVDDGTLGDQRKERRPGRQVEDG